MARIVLRTLPLITKNTVYLITLQKVYRLIDSNININYPVIGLLILPIMFIVFRVCAILLTFIMYETSEGFLLKNSVT